MGLLPSERRAADFVRKIGLERAGRVLDAVSRRFERRFNQACKDAGIPLNREWVRRTPFEIELTHTLKTGMMIVDDSHSPTAAHARILARIANRKAKRCTKSV